MSLMTMQRGERARVEGAPFILVADHLDKLERAWWRGWRIGALIMAVIIVTAVLTIDVAFGQMVPPPVPTTYTFTLKPDEALAMLQAIERASQMQALATGERSARFDAVEAELRQSALDQEKAAAAKVAEKPKDEPKP